MVFPCFELLDFFVAYNVENEMLHHKEFVLKNQFIAVLDFFYVCHLMYVGDTCRSKHALQ